jgi:hypothetical protein
MSWASWSLSIALDLLNLFSGVLSCEVVCCTSHDEVCRLKLFRDPPIWTNSTIVDDEALKILTM